MRINCKGRLIDLSKPKIMGILNVTPDSFFEGSRGQTIDSAIAKAKKMIEEGADFIDIGGMSTRPGAEEISEEEEIKRVLPVIQCILQEFPEALISVDTYRSKVAEKSVVAGAAIINDISAGNLDENLLKTVAEMKVPYVLMHMQGTPQTMQKNPMYENVTLEVNQFFAQKINEIRALGVNDIILDPGFGFGKTVEQNYELFRNLEMIGFGEFPLLVGVSRKSMITKLLNVHQNDALNGTTILHTMALQKGANILRVHDVKEAKEVIKIWEQIQ